MTASIRLVIVGSLLLGVSSLGAGPPAVRADLVELRSPIPTTRMTAFWRLVNPQARRELNPKEGTVRLLSENPDNREAIITGLIELLSRENKVIFEAPDGSLSEGYGNYHASLIWSVATLGDPRAADALMGAVKTGGLALNGLIALGKDAMTAVTKGLDSSDSAVRTAATMVLGSLSQQRASNGLEPSDLEQIRTRLLRSLLDEDPTVRFAAILSLESYRDEGVSRAIGTVAIGDTVERVRAAAQSWISRSR